MQNLETMPINGLRTIYWKPKKEGHMIRKILLKWKLCISLDYSPLNIEFYILLKAIAPLMLTLISILLLKIEFVKLYIGKEAKWNFKEMWEYYHKKVSSICSENNLLIF